MVVKTFVVLALPSLLTTLLTGCSFPEDQNIAISQSDATGKWIFDSQQFAAESDVVAQPKGSSLELKNDGSFSLHDTVQFWQRDGNHKFSGHVMNASGSWKTASDSQGSYILLTFTIVDGQAVTDVKSIHAQRHPEGLRLRVTVGDPDQREWIDYRKS